MVVGSKKPAAIKVEPGDCLKSGVTRTFNRYGKARTALLPCLLKAQEMQGYITEEAVNYLNQLFKVPSASIIGLTSFYGMLSTKKQGKYVVRVCNSLPCQLNAAQDLLKAVETELGIKNGDTTDDNLFTLEVVACLGLCDKAPGMMINEKTYGPLTEADVKVIFNNLKENG
jgi:NADH-quinone oxidoreductase subunit E